ncbi:MAG TPA: hypothetical protein VK563_10050 [Puia sp.]|nr:hypothetical protein [Puia sp.]
MPAYLSLVLLLFGLSVSAQRTMPDSPPGQPDQFSGLSARFDSYRANTVEEKVFVHTDKSFYLAGEIVWFKCYVVDGSFHRPLDLSKLAYVEILSADQRPFLQGKIALKEGFGNGSFQLPFSIHSGNYTFRAYTHWMKNFSPDQYFEKTITIVNSLKNAAPSRTEAGDPTSGAGKAPAYDIQFFPEGGNMVYGMTSKLAFRAVDQSGKGLNCRGLIVNAQNDTVVRFQTLHAGMGQFLFTPVKGNHYKAILETDAHSPVTPELPAIYEQGYVMSVSDTPVAGASQIKVTVHCNAQPSSSDVYLFVHTRGSVKRTERKALTDGTAQFLIDKSILGQGISHLTIFSQDKKPVCERLYFIAPAKMKLELRSDQTEYTSRQKINMELSAQDATGQPAMMNMSMAVYLIDSLQPVEQEDIQNYLLLSSDLKGAIGSPDYYFTSGDRQAGEALEDLLLTQGWSRFRWDNILQDKASSFEFLPEYAGQVVTGVLTDKRSGLPVQNIPAYLSVPGQQFRLSNSVSNKRGQVRFIIADLYGPHEIVMQAGGAGDSLYAIDIASPYSDQFSKRKLPDFLLPQKWQDALVFRSIGAQTQNAYQPDKKQRFYSPSIPDTTAFYGTPDKKYFLDEYVRFTTMEEVMREYVKEVRVRNNKGKFEYAVRSDQSTEFFFDAGPLILFDGVPISDATRIIQFDPLKIKKVEVMTKRYCFGPSVNDGIVSYTTYQGDLAGLPLDPGAFILEYQGSQLQREFYTPIYDNVQQSLTRIPDLRNLLYWSPDVLTDEKGKKQLHFYTSDLPGNYAVVIQGISPDGQPARITSTILVKKSPVKAQP